MADMSNKPSHLLARAFEMAGWRTVDIRPLSRERQETAGAPIQSTLREELSHIDFSWVSFNNADESGGVSRLPDIEESTLRELTMHQAMGGKSGREGPADSAHWKTGKELAMSKKGAWKDKQYDACTLQGARRMRRCIRHNVEEIQLWPDMRCRHIHHPQEWATQSAKGDSVWHPAAEQEEYSACLIFHIVYSVSAWAHRLGRRRSPSLENLRLNAQDRRERLKLGARALRDWAMIPIAMAVGIDPRQLASTYPHEAAPIGKRIQAEKRRSLAADEIYTEHGYHSHRQRASKQASPLHSGTGWDH